MCIHVPPYVVSPPKDILYVAYSLGFVWLFYREHIYMQFKCNYKSINSFSMYPSVSSITNIGDPSLNICLVQKIKEWLALCCSNYRQLSTPFLVTKISVLPEPLWREGIFCYSFYSLVV